MDTTATLTQEARSTESDPSVLRDLHGRKMNSINDVSVALDVQHEMLKSAAGGLYLGREAVQRALTPRADDSVTRVLDLGTGSGKWAIDMAKEFPHADVLGVDLAPVIPSSCVALGLVKAQKPDFHQFHF
ncbi:hypothetical protein FRC00_007083 [Tulasnella sp. 408]|nr:hypothetical protein FRC00_007083 [Tulasnella sp. 408]